MSGEEPTTQITPVESPQMVSTVKLPILKKVILNGYGPIQVTTDENGVETEVLPKTAQALLQRQRERKAKSILLLAILDEYQLRFHGIKDAKSLWAAIKSLDKAYDRFQKLISLLKVHGAAVSNEDVNQKFLRALPSSWNNVALIMRNKDDIDDLDIDDLYNNLKVFEADIKGSSGLSSNSQNVAFLSAEDTSSSNEVNTANGVSTASSHNSQGQAFSSSYTDDLMFSFFANQSNSPQLDDEDLEQIDHDDLEEMDLKWQVAMLSIRVKRFYKKTGRNLIFNGKEPVGFDKTKVECFNCHRRGHFARECRALRNQGNKNGDAGKMLCFSKMDWSYIAQDEPTEFTLIAYTANSSRSGTELGLESVEAQLVVHQKNEVVYEENIAVLEFEVKDKIEASTSQTSNTSVEMPRVESVRPSEVIIEDWVSDDEDIFQSNDLQVTDKADLSFAGLDDSVYRPTANKTSYLKCYYSHLIKDCDFHEKRMAKKSVLKNIGKNTVGQIAVSAVKGNGVTAVKASAGCVWRPKMTDLNNVSKDNSGSWVSKRGNPQQALKNKGIFDSGCSRHMTGNKDFLIDYQDIDGGFVAFGGSARGGKITGKGKIRTDKLDFEDVFFVKELKFNLFSVSQMCDKKNSVLFTETECLVLSPDFKLLDESQVLLRVPRQSNMYSFDLKNVVPSGDLTCLFAKATIDESKLWHRRLGHVNFKTMNKLVKGNLVRGLPSKIFDNDHTCVACQKGKQHKASCKAKLVSSISQPLQMLHMDLFGPTSVRSINHKTYCLVVTDDFSRFSWVFFLASKDETSGILKRFITEIENQLNHKVKVIRCDNGTEFKNREMNEFYGLKRIKREFSVARTPQQNRVTDRKNRTLIEAARTMLADSLLPTVF
ncbi:putative ribonuclease H-like domain-containing protein [Tanacetum coccineum]